MKSFQGHEHPSQHPRRPEILDPVDVEMTNKYEMGTRSNTHFGNLASVVLVAVAVIEHWSNRDAGHVRWKEPVEATLARCAFKVKRFQSILFFVGGTTVGVIEDVRPIATRILEQSNGLLGREGDKGPYVVRRYSQIATGLDVFDPS